MEELIRISSIFPTITVFPKEMLRPILPDIVKSGHGCLLIADMQTFTSVHSLGEHSIAISYEIGGDI